jgi:hypothetical protein
MSDENDLRWNEERRGWDQKHELWLSKYDKYVLSWELKLRVMQLKSTRDKCGISPDDKDAEPNKHIESILTFCKQLEIELDE